MVHDAGNTARADAGLHTRRCATRRRSGAQFPATSRTSSRAVAKTSPRCERHARTARRGHRRVAGSGRPRGRAPGVPRLPVLFFRTHGGAEQWLRDPARTAVRLRARISPTCRMNDDVRRGVELRVFPGTPQELRLLSVHLKSGCARDPLDFDPAELRRAGPPDPGTRALDRRPGARAQALRGARGFQP